MKVYGKRGSSIVIYASQTEHSEVELSDYESEPDASLESDHQSLEKELLEKRTESPAVISSSVDDQNHSPRDVKASSSLSPSIESSSTDLKAFDFLDRTKQVKKRRRTLHQTPLNANENAACTRLKDANPFYETIEDLNKFISSLKGADESSLQEIFKKELEKSLEQDNSVSSGKLTYDHSRTILQSKDEEEELEIEEDEPKPSKEQKDNEQTCHINELKNMGDILKYQDDLELLLDGSPTEMSPSQFLSNLLSIALTMNGDEEFRRYVNDRQVTEMWQWFFSQKDLHNSILILIQGFLSTKFLLPFDDLPHFFQDFVATLCTNSELPNGNVLGTKIAQLNYRDFLHMTQQRTPQEYALQLCLHYPVILSSKRLVRSIMDNFLKKNRFLEKLFPVIEHVACSEPILRDFALASTLFESLVEYLPMHCTNDSLIKCLILLTNEMSMPREKMALEMCVDFMLDHIWPPRHELTDILILHLGFCLNVIGHSNKISVDNSKWALAHSVFSKLSHCHEIDNFLVNMFYLNFAYMTVSLEKKLPSRTKSSLIETLSSFAQEAQQYNKSIPDKIKYISKKL